MSIRIGTNPIAWSNDDMRELGSETSLETCLKEARAAGFEGIELGHKFPRDSKILAPILKEHDLDLVGGWYSTELLTRDVKSEIEAVQSHLRLLKDMGCEVFIMAETSNAIHGDIQKSLNDHPEIGGQEWVDFTQRMSDFSKWLRDQGMTPAYHHHMGTAIETEEEVDRFMELTSDDVGLLMDAGHATFAGIDPVAFTRKYMDRITHIHCKDIRLDIRDHAVSTGQSFLNAVVDGVYTVPGDGDVDFPSILQIAKEHNYHGWLVVEAEQDPAKANPFTYAKMGYENLARMATEAGFIQAKAA